MDRARTLLRPIVGLGIAAGLLWLLFRDTDWSEVGDAIRGLHLGWLLAAEAALFASYFTRVQRWSYVVRASHPASFRSLYAATQIGFLVNFTVPARIGELVRAVVLARLARLPVARALAMVALDRVSDVIGLLAVLLVAAAAFTRERDASFPPGSFGNTEALVVSSRLIQPTALSVAAAAAALLGLLALLYARREHVVGLVRRVLAWISGGLAERVAGLMESFADGMHVFRSGGDLARTLLWSLLTWGANVAAIAALVAAFHVSFPWYTPFLVLGLTAVAIAVPVAPGVIGQYHLPVVAGLVMAIPELAPARAKAIALVSHAAVLVPIAVLGLHALLSERLAFGEVVRESAQSGDGGTGPAEPRA